MQSGHSSSTKSSIDSARVGTTPSPPTRQSTFVTDGVELRSNPYGAIGDGRPDNAGDPSQAARRPSLQGLSTAPSPWSNATRSSANHQRRDVTSPSTNGIYISIYTAFGDSENRFGNADIAKMNDDGYAFSAEPITNIIMISGIDFAQLVQASAHLSDIMVHAEGYAMLYGGKGIVMQFDSINLAIQARDTVRTVSQQLPKLDLHRFPIIECISARAYKLLAGKPPAVKTENSLGGPYVTMTEDRAKAVISKSMRQDPESGHVLFQAFPYETVWAAAASLPFSDQVKAFLVAQIYTAVREHGIYCGSKPTDFFMINNHSNSVLTFVVKYNSTTPEHASQMANDGLVLPGTSLCLVKRAYHESMLTQWYTAREAYGARFDNESVLIRVRHWGNSGTMVWPAEESPTSDCQQTYGSNRPDVLLSGISRRSLGGNGGLSNNTVNIERIKDGQDCRTTVMLRHIPPEVTSNDLLAMLNKYVPGKFDFAYLRIDFAKWTNVGYAFINFADPLYIIDFAQKVQGKAWHEDCTRTADISYATVQGRETLIQKFRNSSVMQEAEAFRPRLFTINPGNIGEEENFPAPDNLVKLQRSVQNASTIGLFNRHNRPAHLSRSFRGMFDRGNSMSLAEQQTGMGSGVGRRFGRRFL